MIYVYAVCVYHKLCDTDVEIMHILCVHCSKEGDNILCRGIKKKPVTVRFPSYKQ